MIQIFLSTRTKKYDVVFVGSKYGWRKYLIEKLQSKGLKIDVFGPGWENGSLNNKEMAKVFGMSKIILGIGYVGYNKSIITLKCRDFDAPMSGALYLTTKIHI